MLHCGCLNSLLFILTMLKDKAGILLYFIYILYTNQFMICFSIFMGFVDNMSYQQTYS